MRYFLDGKFGRFRYRFRIRDVKEIESDKIMVSMEDKFSDKFLERDVLIYGG